MQALGGIVLQVCVKAKRIKDNGHTIYMMRRSDGVLDGYECYLWDYYKYKGRIYLFAVENEKKIQTLSEKTVKRLIEILKPEPLPEIIVDKSTQL